MGTYKFYAEGPGMLYQPPGVCVFKKRVNLPQIIAGGIRGGLANSAGQMVALPALGFAAADILQVFQVPAGFLLKSVGIRVVTVEGAVCTIDIGCNSATETHLLAVDADGFASNLNLNALTSQLNSVAAAQLGPNTAAGVGNIGVLYVAEGSIDITFDSADTGAAVFDIWAEGLMVF